MCDAIKVQEPPEKQLNSEIGNFNSKNSNKSLVMKTVNGNSIEPVGDLSSILFGISVDNYELNSNQLGINSSSVSLSPSTAAPMKMIDKNGEPLPVVVSRSIYGENRSKRTPRVNIVLLNDELVEDQIPIPLSPSVFTAEAQSMIASLEASHCKGDDGEQNNVVENGEEPEVLLTPINGECLNEHESLVLEGGDRDTFKGDNLSVNDDSGSLNSYRNSSIEANMKDLLENNMVNDERCFKLEHVLENLRKENLTLKEQLKKYISAVQMLQPEVKDFLQDFIDSDESPTAKSSSTATLQLYPGAIEYEKKLIQLAEMHGELVEFNERLHRIIFHKDLTIQRLKNELIELRGPLPETNQSSDEDDFSIASEYETSIVSIPSNVNLPLINIWIPTAFLASQSKSTSSHHVYQIYVRVKEEEWNVYRRYSQFYALYKNLKKNFSGHNLIREEFPPKKTIGNRDAKVVQERRKKLEAYLRAAVNLLQASKNIADKSSLIDALPFLDEKKTNPQSTSRSDSHQDENDPNSSVTQCYGGY